MCKAIVSMFLFSFSYDILKFQLSTPIWSGTNLPVGKLSLER